MVSGAVRIEVSILVSNIRAVSEVTMASSPFAASTKKIF